MAIRKNLSHCFQVAQQRFFNEIASPLISKNHKHQDAVDRFLAGMELTRLEKFCKDLSSKAEDHANNNAAKLCTTLDQLKGAADVFMAFAPESVSIVWFGISSLITIGNARLQTRLLICGTCDSIANIIGDCVRWEARMHNSEDRDASSQFDIWESDLPDLIFAILDFLWSARPHMDESRIKRIGSSVKDLFTKDLQQKIDTVLGKYEEIVKQAHAHFEESVLQESLKTGLKIDEILSNMKKYASISSDLLEAVQRGSLQDEVNRQQAKIRDSVSYKDHFTALNDRVDRIIKDRGGRLIAGWLFKEESYMDWKSNSTTSFLCLKGPRGHGKSAAMMSAYKEITKNFDGTMPPVICHFFFKKGDQDIQSARTCVESILHQLLSRDELHNNTQALVAAIEALNPGFGSTDTGGGTTVDFLADIDSICTAIRKVGEAIPAKVYIMVDALDECHDRQDYDLSLYLKGLVKSQTTRLRVIISARDSINIVAELLGSEEEHKCAGTLSDLLPDNVGLIEITAEKNSTDLREYLQHDVSSLLRRRIDPQLSDFFNLELSRIVAIIEQKAKGDFTLARMIIANLQQPSKETLERKVQQLPAAIGAIYMSSIEALSPDEQELVVSALKWVVWSVSAITVIEISDHYRELYQRAGESEKYLEENGTGGSPDHELIFQKIEKLIKENPYQDPEIKDIIYHLENAGRDFFKFDRKTGIVGVDVSIREWIQDDTQTSKTVSATREARGFHRYREDGNTVFKFTLTPSFVQYGDTLSELFNKKEAHMSMALSILRALNNESFQNKYMPRPRFVDDSKVTRHVRSSYVTKLTPFNNKVELFKHLRGWRERDDFESIKQWIGETDEAEEVLAPPETSVGMTGEGLGTSPENSKEKVGKDTDNKRYELEHWHSHIRILQTWWNDGSIEDSWWSDLLVELSIFTRLENWYRWRAAVSKCEGDRNPTLGNLLFEHPIHTASKLGLHLLVELLMEGSRIETKAEERQPRQPSIAQTFEALKVFHNQISSFSFQINWPGFGGRITNEQLIDCITLKAIANKETTEDVGLGDPDTLAELMALFEAIDPKLRVAWLAYQQQNMLSLSSEIPEASLFSEFISIITSSNQVHPTLAKDIEVFTEGCSSDKAKLAGKLRATIATIPPYHLGPDEKPLCDLSDPDDHSPLYLASSYPDTIKCLIKHGADVNPEIQEDYYPDTEQSSAPESANEAYSRFLPASYLFPQNKPRQPLLLEMLLELGELQDPSGGKLNGYLKSAKILIAEGARLDVENSKGVNLIHAAAQVRDLKFFKLLCVSWEWDVHKGDLSGCTPLHHLFHDPAPKDPNRVKETLGICDVILKLKKPEVSESEFIDAEDWNSETPLAYAVKARFKEAVNLLIKLGANVHDECLGGGNCFNHLLLWSESNPDVNATIVQIAQMLLNAGLDCAKQMNSGWYRYPIARAILDRRTLIVEMLLPRYSEAGKQHPDSNPLLAHDGYSLETWAHLLIQTGYDRSRSQTVQSGHPDSETSIRLLKLLIELVSDHTDPAEYIARTDAENWNALRRAVRLYEIKLVKFVTALNPDITPRDRDGFNVLDYWCKMLHIDFFTKEDWDDEELRARERGREILYHLIEMNRQTTLPFSFLETALFEPPFLTKLNEAFDLKKILSVFSHPYRDEHGWTLYDFLLCNNRHDLLQYLPPGLRLSKPERFLNPSRLGHIRAPGFAVSDDGLECSTSIDIMPWNNDDLCAFILADNPVPPVDRTFYFEVHIPKVVSGWQKTENSDPIQWAVGFEAIVPARKDLVHYGTNGLVGVGGAPQMWPYRTNEEDPNPTESSSAETPGSKYCRLPEVPKVVGSGINAFTNKVFFTVNGILLPASFDVPPRRYFPSWSFYYPPQRVKVNFGGEPFSFARANDPEWKWGGVAKIEENYPFTFTNQDKMSQEEALKLDDSLDFKQLVSDDEDDEDDEESL
ncbi:hypothetical protein TWF730_000574 [Orbilia blumenaviensis]|uniref:B30.2/SPRY domain-containing protein n=1 Tax=Orbilia blumenaviensis TaxID=1796055 RepID=A0AAV9VLZ1_9PEZI